MSRSLSLLGWLDACMRYSLMHAREARLFPRRQPATPDGRIPRRRSRSHSSSAPRPSAAAAAVPPGYTFLRLNLLDFLVLVLCARLLLDLSQCPLQLLTRRSVEILFVLDVPATSRSDPLEIPIAVRVVQPLRTRGAVETQKKVQT
jgi:hypothetical protein